MNKSDGRSSPPVRLATLGVLYAALTFATVYAVADDDNDQPSQASLLTSLSQEASGQESSQAGVAAQSVNPTGQTDRWQRVSSAQ